MSDSVFLGTYKLVSSDGVAEFFKAIGFQHSDGSTVSVKYEKKDEYFWETIKCTDAVYTQFFKFDEPNEYEGSDGRKVKRTYSLKGNVLTDTRVYDGKLTAVVARKFTGDKLETTYSSEGVKSASAQFEKV